MAIIVRVDRVLADRKMTLTELSRRVDITLANLSNLKTGKAKAIRFSTLDAICQALVVSQATYWNTRPMTQGRRLHLSRSATRCSEGVTRLQSNIILEGNKHHRGVSCI